RLRRPAAPAHRGPGAGLRRARRAAVRGPLRPHLGQRHPRVRVRLRRPRARRVRAAGPAGLPQRPVGPGRLGPLRQRHGHRLILRIPAPKEAALYQEGSRSFELDGVRVLEDSHDKQQWVYLATQVELGKTPDGSPAFSFIEYKPAAVAAGVKGGGYLTFRSQIVLPEATRQRILGRI